MRAGVCLGAPPRLFSLSLRKILALLLAAEMMIDEIDVLVLYAICNGNPNA